MSVPTLQPRKQFDQPPRALPFPADILSSIFAILLDVHPPSLAKCCRLNRQISQIASPILYRRIRVSPFERLDSRADHSLNRYTSSGKDNMHTRKNKLLKTAELVVFDQHLSPWCGDKTFNYPHLKVLVINMGITPLGPVLHINDAFGKQCPLLKGRQPKKIVIQGACLTNISGDCQGVPIKLYDIVEEITYVCPAIELSPTRRYGGFSMMTQLKKVTWIFHTAIPGEHWTLGTQSRPGETLSDRVDMTTLTVMASMMMQWPNVRIVIVNAGSIDFQLHTGQTNEKANEDKFKEQLKGAIDVEFDSKNQKSKDREAKVAQQVATLHFVSMRDYLRTQDWTGEITPAVAKAWLASA